jgi:hypothetical protein
MQAFFGPQVGSEASPPSCRKIAKQRQLLAQAQNASNYDPGCPAIRHAAIRDSYVGTRIAVGVHGSGDCKILHLRVCPSWIYPTRARHLARRSVVGMRRRDFIIFVGGVAAQPLHVQAQPLHYAMSSEKRIGSIDRVKCSHTHRNIELSGWQSGDRFGVVISPAHKPNRGDPLAPGMCQHAGQFPMAFTPVSF